MKLNKSTVNWALIVLFSMPFLISALMKLSGSGEVVKSATACGVEAYKLKFIGLIELVCLALFIIPRTGVLGTLLFAAYLGGAVATHIEHNQSVLTPVVFETLLFVIAANRYPELTNRIFNKQS